MKAPRGAFMRLRFTIGKGRRLMRQGWSAARGAWSERGGSCRRSFSGWLSIELLAGRHLVSESPGLRLGPLIKPSCEPAGQAPGHRAGGGREGRERGNIL